MTADDTPGDPGSALDERVPIFRQIADQVRAAVLSGELAPGDRLPSAGQYAVYYRVNPATVFRAFRELLDEGVIRRQRGVGMFIDTNAADTLRDTHRSAFFEKVVDPMLNEARVLGIPPERIVEHIRGRSGENK